MRSFIIKYVFIVLLFGGVFDFTLKGQDIHFSQFFFSPQITNPANTGNFDGSWRANNNTRRQWGAITPYTTFSFGFDHQFSVKSHDVAGGLVLVNDISNNAGLIANKLYASGAYFKDIGDHQFIGGLQIGVVNKHFNSNKLSYPDQFNEGSGSFDAGMGTAETGFRNSMTYPDINIGLNWRADFSRFEPKMGLALFHVNSPNESFDPSYKNPLPMRVNVHGGTDVHITDEVYLTPNVIYMNMGNLSSTIFGGHATYVLSGDMLENSVFAGLYARNGSENNSMIMLVGGNYQNWSVGLSYDFNTSDLRTSSSNPGGFEVSVIYKEISTQIQKFFIPCERF